MEAGCFTCKAIDSLWRRLKRVSTSPVSADIELAAGCGKGIPLGGRPTLPTLHQPYTGREMAGTAGTGDSGAA